ncbi:MULTISPECIES: TrmH family RNA methyltransferase [Streptomyces]|uniref:TrmH family RNA methyltransferase n=1 Tax=Streptomyces TaxID=1883 RepID=UPI00190E31E3|nr:MULTISPECIES: RNA methyltransferase [unclassified Streptomyces]MBK3628777.1 RNA methyltransferase [Streptomyces sp. MBT49]MBK3636634.1 RNA methyltransferase [Streptomyces sp. MBT97]
MADLISVEDPDDPRLRDYTGLTDVELRRKREPAEGLFIAEGEKVIRRAKDAGYEMRSMLLSAKWVDVMRDVIDELPAPVYAVTPELAERVTGYHVHRGALASMQRKPLPTAADLLLAARRGVVPADPPDDAGQRVAIFEGFVDHANLGAAFRSAAALGIRAILLSPDCADPLYRRAIKVSMGAVFSVPYARFDTWPAGLDVVRDAGYDILAMTPDEKATPLDRLHPERFERCAIMLGSEGHGLSTYALRAADEWVRIPMSAGIDSLNVAAASAVAFYATRPRPA